MKDFVYFTGDHIEILKEDTVTLYNEREKLYFLLSGSSGGGGAGLTEPGGHGGHGLLCMIGPFQVRAPVRFVIGKAGCGGCKATNYHGTDGTDTYVAFRDPEDRTKEVIIAKVEGGKGGKAGGRNISGVIPNLGGDGENGQIVVFKSSTSVNNIETIVNHDVLNRFLFKDNNQEDITDD